MKKLTKKSRYVQVGVSKEVYLKIKEIAKKEGKTMSNLINSLIVEYIEKEEECITK